MKARRKLRVDLDGVMVDFDGYVRANLSVEAQRNQKQFWIEFAAKRYPYRKLKPMSYARDMWGEIMRLTDEHNLDTAILTAIPRRDTMPTAENDKIWWCTVEHKDDVFWGEAPRVFIGPYARDKASHCSPGAVLIDDRMDNCEQWAAAGGIAIHHTGDWRATIRSLAKILAE